VLGLAKGFDAGSCDGAAWAKVATAAATAKARMWERFIFSPV
jgi:hypothetical protein